jgi:ABC-2 type transport system ATP-binding protein
VLAASSKVALLPGIASMTVTATPSAEPPGDAIIVVQGVTKRYGDVAALRGIDLTVRAGEMFALLGPNGAGKTSLFSILATLRRLTGGRATLCGHDVTTARAAVRQNIGIVFQEPAIERRLTVRDNLELMARCYGLGAAEARRRAGTLLEKLRLQEAADRPAEQTSGGQRRRIELARALVARPRVLFLDEATLGLDVDGRRQFWAEVRRMAAEGLTVFFTTHYMEEADVADRIALIAEGRIIALGSPQELKAGFGGGVIRLSTDDDQAAAAWLAGRGFKATTAEKQLLLVHADPAAVLPMLVRELPVRVQRVEMHAPSLEDVFLELTGRGLGGEAAALPRANGGSPP